MRILVVGGYGVGLSFFTERPPADDETISGARFSQEHGGKASNQAVGVARLGIPVNLLTAVGSDWYAHAARDMWAAEGVDASAAITIESVTMVGAINTDATGENRIILANGVLDQLTPADIGAHAAIFESVDTTGEGDATNAALAAALTCGAGPVEVARFVNCAGVPTVEKEGVLPGIPSIDDLHTRFGAQCCAVVLSRNS